MQRPSRYASNAKNVWLMKVGKNEDEECNYYQISSGVGGRLSCSVPTPSQVTAKLSPDGMKRESGFVTGP